jgi:hypothetical protein
MSMLVLFLRPLRTDEGWKSVLTKKGFGTSPQFISNKFKKALAWPPRK